jgi:hypothetical protein
LDALDSAHPFYDGYAAFGQLGNPDQAYMSSADSPKLQVSTVPKTPTPDAAVDQTDPSIQYGTYSLMLEGGSSNASFRDWSVVSETVNGKTQFIAALSETSWTLSADSDTASGAPDVAVPAGDAATGGVPPTDPPLLTGTTANAKMNSTQDTVTGLGADDPKRYVPVGFTR